MYTNICIDSTIVLNFSFTNVAFFFVLFSATVNAMERTEIKINIISEQLGLSWAGQTLLKKKNSSQSLVDTFVDSRASVFGRVGPRASVWSG